MNKFEARLNASGTGIRGERTTIVSKQTSNAQAKYVQALEDKKLALEEKRMRLEDINVDSELSTKVVNDGFLPEKWVADLNKIEVEILEVEVLIAAADRVTKRWFTEVAEETV